jgi:Uncharacterised protein family (UPF0158)
MAGMEWRTQLRGAVYRGDGQAVIRLARTDLKRNTTALQLIGDGLIRALTEQIEGAAELAADCVTALAERDWPGDTELGEQLQALLGIGPTPMLRPLPVDLADILEGDPTHGGGLLDLHTGEVWPQATIDYAHDNRGEIAGAPDEDEDPDRWLPVTCEGSHDSYHDMETFIDTLADPNQADRLQIAIQGRGAFRRFKDILGRTPDELDRWFAFSEERQRGRARTWLADAGYKPLTAPTTIYPA